MRKAWISALPRRENSSSALHQDRLCPPSFFPGQPFLLRKFPLGNSGSKALSAIFTAVKQKVIKTKNQTEKGEIVERELKRMNGAFTGLVESN